MSFWEFVDKNSVGLGVLVALAMSLMTIVAMAFMKAWVERGKRGK